MISCASVSTLEHGTLELPISAVAAGYSATHIDVCIPQPRTHVRLLLGTRPKNMPLYTHEHIRAYTICVMRIDDRDHENMPTSIRCSLAGISIRAGYCARVEWYMERDANHKVLPIGRIVIYEHADMYLHYWHRK